MNINIQTVTFDAKQSPILDSKEVRYIRGGVTLDQSAVTADVSTGLKKLPAGTFIGVTGGKYRKYTAAVKASLSTTGGNENSNIKFEAVGSGTDGNSIKVAMINAGNSKSLEVTVVNNEVRIQLATNSGGTITSTAAEVIAAVNGALAVKGILTAAVVGAQTGEGVVAALSATELANGANANVVPTCVLAEDVLFTRFSESGGITHVDQIATAIDAGRVIASRLPVAPDAVVKANIPGVQYV